MSTQGPKGSISCWMCRDEGLTNGEVLPSVNEQGTCILHQAGDGSLAALKCKVYFPEESLPRVPVRRTPPPLKGGLKKLLSVLSLPPVVHGQNALSCVALAYDEVAPTRSPLVRDKKGVKTIRNRESRAHAKRAPDGPKPQPARAAAYEAQRQAAKAERRDRYVAAASKLITEGKYPSGQQIAVLVGDTPRVATYHLLKDGELQRRIGQLQSAAETELETAKLQIAVDKILAAVTRLHRRKLSPTRRAIASEASVPLHVVYRLALEDDRVVKAIEAVVAALKMVAIKRTADGRVAALVKAARTMGEEDKPFSVTVAARMSKMSLTVVQRKLGSAVVDQMKETWAVARFEARRAKICAALEWLRENKVQPTLPALASRSRISYTQLVLFLRKHPDIRALISSDLAPTSP